MNIRSISSSWFGWLMAAALLVSGCDNASNSELEPAAISVSEPVQAVDAPDRVLVNGKVLTVDDDFSIAEAIAIKDDRIVAVGTSAEIRDLAGPETDVVELGGRTVIPGLIDNHMHFIRAAQRWNLQARIDGINSRQEALDAIAAKAATMEPGEWLMVQGGWSEGQFADQPGGFTLEELDAAAPNNPLFLQILYVRAYANTLALEAVGIDPSTGANQGPPAIVAEPPYGLFNEQMPEVSEAQKEQNLLDVIATMNRAGLTSVYDVGRPPEGDISLLDRMSVDGPLNMRVWHTLKYQAYDPDGAAAAIELIKNNAANSTDDYLGLLGIGEHVYLPLFDLPNVTEPYPDDVVTVFEDISRAAAEGGYRINEHSMMDVTITDILRAWENVNGDINIEPLRWSLEHVLTISQENIDRARDLGVTATVHSVAMHMPEFLQPPIRKMQDSGLLWGLGTDGTIVAHYQPFITLGWVVTGRSINGNQLMPVEATVTREEALIAHTRSNAFLLFKDEDLGTLEPGKLADLVVLDKDYMTVEEDEIFYIQPLMTMVGGRVVYDELPQAATPAADPAATAGAAPPAGMGAPRPEITGDPRPEIAGGPPPNGMGGPARRGPPPEEAIPNIDPSEVAVFKTIADVELSAHIFNPPNHTADSAAPALIFFHGGGLRRGDPTQGYAIAERFIDDGVVVISPEYRLLNQDAETLDQIVADAKSLIRWVRDNADDLGINPDQIVASGHSAGAYLSMVSGVIPGLDEPSEDQSVSSVPNALVLWSSATTRRDDPENSMVPEGRTMAEFSAPAILPDNLPPALFIHGDEDPIAPYEASLEFESKYRSAGNQANFVTVEGADHFFRDSGHREQAMASIGTFLGELGYIR